MRMLVSVTEPSISRRSEFIIPIERGTYRQDGLVNYSPVRDGILNQQLEEYSKTLEKNGTAVKFSVHKETHSIVVKIVDAVTDEVIKEIPPEKILDLVYNLCKNVGLILDERY